MRRTLIAAAWLIGTTVPVLLSTVFIFGCCVLPFHGVLHKVLPLCELAGGVMSGHHPGGDDERSQRSTPARAKEQMSPRFVTAVSRIFRLRFAPDSRAHVLRASTDYRSFITLGAVRCDRDVGLNVFLAILLI